MNFNREYFDTGLNRMNTRSIKWDVIREQHGDQVLPMWVADMDFPSPPAVQEAILRRAAHPTYCYTSILPDDITAVTDFWARRHGLQLQPEDVLMLPCVVSGMKVAIRALTAPGDGVIITSPVYGPFRFSVEATGRRLCDCPMLRDETGRYSLNMDVIRQQLENGARLMMLCNPHNPVSRLWKREELVALLHLLNEYDAILVSDEIHADFVYAPGEFVPALSLQRKNVVSFAAASKTFNLAGLQQASCFCPDPDLREKLSHAIEESGVTSGNIFALEATRAAYLEGDDWLDGLIAYLDENRQVMTGFIRDELPTVLLTPIEATYLAWLDLSRTGLDDETLQKRILEAGLMVNAGTFFGRGGESHIRINFACPTRLLYEGMARLKNALN